MPVSFEETEIVVSPAPFAERIPFLSTSTIFSSADFQVTVLLRAPPGVKMGLTRSLSPLSKEITSFSESLLLLPYGISSIFVTLSPTTFTEHVANLLPSSVVTFTMNEP